MANQADIDRAKQGKEVWNAWAEEELKKPMEERETVDFSVATLTDQTFNGYIFPGKAIFRDSQFPGTILVDAPGLPGLASHRLLHFRNAVFWGDANFSEARFPVSAIFANSTFHGDAKFTKCHFSDITIFSGSHFKSTASFQNSSFNASLLNGTRFDSWCDFHSCVFNEATDFSGSIFSLTPRLHGAKLHQDTKFSENEELERQFSNYKQIHSEQAYRTLKLHMHALHAHREEAFFFKREMQARAAKENLSRRWMYKTYEMVSDYGHSASSPVMVWWIFCLLVTLGYFIRASNSPTTSTAFTASFAQALPFIGAEKDSLKVALDSLFGEGIRPLAFQITRALHMLFSSAMIFLVLLALRNRFKLK